MNTDEAKTSNGTNRWARAAAQPEHRMPLHYAVQKIQTAILDGAGAVWTRVSVTARGNQQHLVIEMIGGDEAGARGLLDPILPTEVSYELQAPSTRVVRMVQAVRAVAQLNHQLKQLYNKAMLKAIRAIGGSFNPRMR